MKAMSLEEFRREVKAARDYAEPIPVSVDFIAEALAQREQLLAACVLARDKGRYDEMQHFATICAAIARAES